jgi:uncharacterized protein YbcI
MGQNCVKTAFPGKQIGARRSHRYNLLAFFKLDKEGLQMGKSKGQIEAEISEALIKFEKEYMGRGPEETKTYIIGDMVVIRLQRVLTPAEQRLAETGGDATGRTLIKRVRTELVEKARPLLEKIVTDLTGRRVRSLHTDISTVSGERVIIFTLESPVVFAD